jgi:hypothetical protein
LGSQPRYSRGLGTFYPYNATPWFPRLGNSRDTAQVTQFFEYAGAYDAATPQRRVAGVGAPPPRMTVPLWTALADTFPCIPDSGMPDPTPTDSTAVANTTADLVRQTSRTMLRRNRQCMRDYLQCTMLAAAHDMDRHELAAAPAAGPGEPTKGAEFRPQMTQRARACRQFVATPAYDGIDAIAALASVDALQAAHEAGVALDSGLRAPPTVSPASSVSSDARALGRHGHDEAFGAREFDYNAHAMHRAPQRAPGDGARDHVREAPAFGRARSPIRPPPPLKSSGRSPVRAHREDPSWRANVESGGRRSKSFGNRDNNGRQGEGGHGGPRMDTWADQKDRGGRTSVMDAAWPEGASREAAAAAAITALPGARRRAIRSYQLNCMVSQCAAGAAGFPMFSPATVLGSTGVATNGTGPAIDANASTGTQPLKWFRGSPTLCSMLLSRLVVIKPGRPPQPLDRDGMDDLDDVLDFLGLPAACPLPTFSMLRVAVSGSGWFRGPAPTAIGAAMTPWSDTLERAALKSAAFADVRERLPPWVAPHMLLGSWQRRSIPFVSPNGTFPNTAAAAAAAAAAATTSTPLGRDLVPGLMAALELTVIVPLSMFAPPTGLADLLASSFPRLAAAYNVQRREFGLPVRGSRIPALGSGLFSNESTMDDLIVLGGMWHPRVSMEVASLTRLVDEVRETAAAGGGGPAVGSFVVDDVVGVPDGATAPDSYDGTTSVSTVLDPVSSEAVTVTTNLTVQHRREARDAICEVTGSAADAIVNASDFQPSAALERVESGITATDAPVVAMPTSTTPSPAGWQRDVNAGQHDMLRTDLRRDSPGIGGWGCGVACVGASIATAAVVAVLAACTAVAARGALVRARVRFTPVATGVAMHSTGAATDGAAAKRAAHTAVPLSRTALAAAAAAAGAEHYQHRHIVPEYDGGPAAAIV